MMTKFISIFKHYMLVIVSLFRAPYCQAQLQLSVKLKAELALFPLDPATHLPSPTYPHPWKFIYEL